MNNVLLNVSWKGTTSICRAASLGTKQESSSVIIATGILRNGMGHSVVQENSNTTFKQSERRGERKGNIMLDDHHRTVRAWMEELGWAGREAARSGPGRQRALN